MKKLWETVLGLFGVAILGVAIWMGFTDGLAPALVFFLLMSIFLGLVALIVEKAGIVLDKVFSPRR